MAVLLVSILPLITLFIRGIGWGSDSFVFYAVSCGRTEFVNSIGTSLGSFFVLFGCNFVFTSFVMFLFYFIALLSLWVIFKPILREHAWLLPIYVGTLTPLFFVEGLRFENDVFGWCLSFLCMALFFIATNIFCNRHKIALTGVNERITPINIVFCVLCLLLSVFIGVIAILLWQFSIILVAGCFLLLEIPQKYKKVFVFILFLIFILFQWDYLLRSFEINPLYWVAEEIPLLGLIYIIHIFHFWRKIPQPFFWYGLGLLTLGLLKSKFLFLATPFLFLALIQKEKSVGLWLKSKRFPEKKLRIDVWLFVIIFGVGLIFSGVSLYPTQSDLLEMQEAIVFSEDNNLLLFNEWGSGWYFEYLGFETIYKMGPPNPDWNSLDKPYLAYSRQEDLNCERISKHTFVC